MPTDTPSVMLFESDADSMKRSAAVIRQAGHRAIETSTNEEAIHGLQDDNLAAILLEHGPAGSELSQYIREFSDIFAPVGAIVSETAQDPQAIVREMNADGFLRRPFSVDTLQSFLSVAQQLSSTRRKMEDLQGSIVELQSRAQRSGLTSPRTGFHHFDAVKDLLVIEVRRAKRYGYPLAVLLVGLDPASTPEASEHPELPRDVTGGLAVAIAKSIRVIDLPIHYADDRILVFLPHTDLSGAEEVGRRIKRRIKRITYRNDELTVNLTASVGVAAISAADTLTFSRIIKDAAAALRAAQLKGGDRVMKRSVKPPTQQIIT